MKIKHEGAATASRKVKNKLSERLGDWSCHTHGRDNGDTKQYYLKSFKHGYGGSRGLKCKNGTKTRY